MEKYTNRNFSGRPDS